MQQDLPPDYSQLSISRSRISLQSDNCPEIHDNINTNCINVRTAQRNANELSSLSVNDLEACSSHIPSQELIDPPTYESLFPEHLSEISTNSESHINNQQA